MSSNRAIQFFQTAAKELPKAITIKNAAKTGLGFIGSFALLLYRKPGEKCAQSPTCGLPVANALGATFATKLYQSGGVDYAGYNIVLSYYSIDAITNYINEQETRGTKAVKIVGIGLYAGMQCLQMMFLAEGSGATAGDTIRLLFAAAPAAGFSATYMLKRELPYVISQVSYAWDCINSFVNPAETYEESQISDKKEYYRDQVNALNVRLQANFKFLVKTSRTNEALNPRYYVFNPENHHLDTQSWFAWGMRALGYASGLTLAGLFTAPGVLNSYQFMQKNIGDYPVLNTLLTAFLASGNIYINTTVTANGFADLWKMIGEGEINSVLWKRERLKTIGFTLLNASLSAFSYAVTNSVIETVFNYPADASERTSLQDGYRYVSWAGIITYHLMSLFHLVALLNKTALGDEYTKKILQLEDELKEYLSMTSDQYQALAEQPQLQYTQRFKERFEAAEKTSERFSADQESLLLEASSLFATTFKSYEVHLREKGLQVNREHWAPYRESKYAKQA